MEYDITTLVANILIGIGLGIGLVALYVWHIIRKFQAEINKLVKDTVQQVEVNMVAVVLEEDAGQLYCYRESDRQFLCQGATLGEIRKLFGQQYPEKTAYLADGHDPMLLERLKTELENIKQQEKSENSLSV
jgi:hypothetical protein